ncbi:MAG TPA: hypothetical protein VH120_19355 [Gemmataceae bacterium]|jgi:hypothetical protein|nr:hypothetical protein [Gemmataceae bacterium]
MTVPDAASLRDGARIKSLDVLIADDNLAGAEALATHLRAAAMLFASCRTGTRRSTRP